MPPVAQSSVNVNCVSLIRTKKGCKSSVWAQSPGSCRCLKFGYCNWFLQFLSQIWVKNRNGQIITEAFIKFFKTIEYAFFKASKRKFPKTMQLLEYYVENSGHKINVTRSQIWQTWHHKRLKTHTSSSRILNKLNTWV